MRPGYRLDQLDKYHWHVVCPFGQPIALVEKYAVGISVTPKISGIGNQKTIRLESDNQREASSYEQHPDMEAACRPFVEAHYKLNTTRPQRFRNWISEWNLRWSWLYGLIATIAAIWGWLD